MFDKIDNLEYIYIFSGHKIYKSKVTKFSKIDSETIFIKAENEGSLIFEKSYRFKKNNKVYALNEESFENEKISLLKNKLKNYDRDISRCRQDIITYKQKIDEYNRQIEHSNTVIQYTTNYMQKIKEEITQEKINEKTT